VYRTVPRRPIGRPGRWPAGSLPRVPEPLTVAIIGNAASLHTRRWARRLADEGHETHLLSEFRPTGPVPGVVWHDILGRRLPHGVGVRRLWRRLHLRRLVRSLDVDLVQTQFIWPYGDWALRTGFRPLVQGAWGSDVLLPRPDRRERIGRIVRAADAVTANSDSLRRAVIGYGVDPARVHLIGWGVDTERYSGRRERSLIDTIFPGRPVVVSPRLHKDLYNLDVLVDAIPLVQREVPDAAFLFMAYGPLTGELQARAHTLGVASSVHFQRFDEADVPLVFAGADVSVSIPSSDTGRPTSLLEAMASGLPLVLSDLPGIRELIDQGDGAELVPLRDPAATASAIARLLRDADLRRAYGERNRRMTVERADAGRETDRCIELYRRLVEQG
jgi:L-malate glycosyltransferase